MNETIAYDAQGNAIAWVREGCTGPNRKCRQGARENRTYHIIPHHNDPRAQNCYIALSTYHYASLDEALEALEKGWERAMTVDNPIDRDEQYYRRNAVKILKNTDNF